MTMTVKLDAPLERSLRQRSADLGRPASALMREALQAYLAETAPEQASSFALGEELFGRYSGPTTLASQRKSDLAQIWNLKRPDATAPAQRVSGPVSGPIKRAVRAKA